MKPFLIISALTGLAVTAIPPAPAPAQAREQEKKNADWAALIAGAEHPLVQFRAKYAEALTRARAAAQEQGRIEDVEEFNAALKDFESGGWPDGVSRSRSLAKLETTFIIHYWRLYPKVEAALRAVAAKSPEGDANATVAKRIAHWRDSPGGSVLHKEKPMMTYTWKTKADLNVKLEIGGGPGLTPRRTAKDLLKECGVGFPDGASAFYNRDKHELLVRNTASNLRVVDQLLAERGLR